MGNTIRGGGHGQPQHAYEEPRTYNIALVAESLSAGSLDTTGGGEGVGTMSRNQTGTMATGKEEEVQVESESMASPLIDGFMRLSPWSWRKEQEQTNMEDSKNRNEVDINNSTGDGAQNLENTTVGDGALPRDQIDQESLLATLNLADPCSADEGDCAHRDRQGEHKDRDIQPHTQYEPHTPDEPHTRQTHTRQTTHTTDD